MITFHQTSEILAFARKIFHLENLSLLLVATPGSLTVASLLNALIADTPMKDLVLPLLVAAVSLSMYFVVFVLDFISGVKASRHEAKDKSDYFRSAKGWSSIWKISTVSILVIWSSFFSMLSALAGIGYLPNFFMLASGTIAIMATLLDIYSIGENQQRISGKKARIFDWLEQVRNTINEGVINRLKNLGRSPP